MRKGNMDDITQENETSSAMDGTETGIDSMSSQGAKQIYEKEALIIIDYSSLEDDIKEVCKKDDFLCRV